MIKYIHLISVIILSSFFQTSILSQVFLVFENLDKIENIKIPIGAKISIKTVHDNNWNTYKIEKLLPNVNIIVHESGILNLSEITHYRRQRKWVKKVSFGLMTFGEAMTVYGLFDLVFGEDPYYHSILTMGIMPIVTGWILKKIWLYKKHKIDKRRKFKILDLSFPENPYH